MPHQIMDCPTTQYARCGFYIPGAQRNTDKFGGRAAALAYWSTCNPGGGDMAKDAVDGRHSKGLNVVYGDGHAAYSNPDKLLWNNVGWFDPPPTDCMQQNPNPKQY